MISYHLDRSFLETRYSKGWQKAMAVDAREVAKIMLQYAWSGVVWADGVRNKNSPGYSRWFGLDFENPEVTLEWAQKNFCDMIHVIGVTRNHRKAKGDQPSMDRFRVALMWESAITCREDYEINLKKLIAKYGADPACYNWSRLFWPCERIVAGSVEGHCMEWTKAPPKPNYPKITKLPHEAMPMRLQRKLIDGAPQGQRHKMLRDISFELGALGYPEDVVVNVVSRSSLKEAEVDYERTIRDAWKAGTKERENQ